jgi:hypothetical protein
MYCPEADRAWTTGNKIDHSSVTIEVADNTNAAPWGCTDKAMAALINLCVDICKRNGISKLNYTGDKSGNLLMHKWYQSTDCPGAYLEGKFSYIASEVNKQLDGAQGTSSAVNTTATATSTASASGKLTIDGSWGQATTKRTQEVLGTTADGTVSNQPTGNKKYLPNASTTSWQFKSSGYSAGSAMIRALQKLIGTTVDGYFGQKSVKALQKFLGVTQDGIMGPATVKAWQTWLNKH